ncbi:helix-turn-helix transcriptional regulator [Flavobacterium buctense]|uniref:Helix-turn-helix transcriptional regulator n=1 Tax=Flavobacterium buctense TaxID=1648146 RepID=A0ABU9DZA2_9FLAO|nr:helix-turn-helix transcriptional regulator [Flavobacterium buctense]
MTTGTKIRTLREQKKISQEALAYSVGVSQVTIGNWEQGKSIKHEYIKRLAEALDISIDYLFEESQSKSVQATSKVDIKNDGFEIIIKAPNHFFEDLHKKMDLLINKLEAPK